MGSDRVKPIISEIFVEWLGKIEKITGYLVIMDFITSNGWRWRCSWMKITVYIYQSEFCSEFGVYMLDIIGYIMLIGQWGCLGWLGN